MATHTTAPTTTPDAATQSTRQTFDIAIRGYDRRQVDEHLAAQAAENAQLRSELRDVQRQRKLATEHAEATEQELRELRAGGAGAVQASPEEGFGFRAEKLLRMAEQEAQEIREHAAKESAAVVEKARTDAEQHRHEVEQSLIARATLLEKQAAQRLAELQDREQQISDQLAAAREQAEQLHDGAARAAEKLRQESEAAAEQTRLHAETAARRHVDQANDEILRLGEIKDAVRSELERLASVLRNELTRDIPRAETGNTQGSAGRRAVPARALAVGGGGS